MRLALLFSGQGGQRPEHGQQLAQIGGRLGEQLRQTLPATVDLENLAKNSVAQPLIFGLQADCWAQLQARLPTPICAAGYSLGEMAACCAAGLFSAEAGLALTVDRARLMDQAASGEHGMLAVLGLDDKRVAELAAAAGLAVAIRNAPHHLVLAGSRAGIAQAAPHFEAAGASRLVHLAVRTPSHTALLSNAAVDFKKCLDLLPAVQADSRLRFPVLSAIDATPARRAAAAGAALARQICTPLDWAACQQAIVEMQPDAVLEIGPGNALAKLFAEHAPQIPVRASDDFRSSDGIVRWVESCAR